MARGFDLDSASDAAKLQARRALSWLQGPGLRAATAVTLTVAHHARRNLVARRIFSLPHALVAIWIVILLWGERWVFDSKVESCSWDHWESWPRGTHPHRLVLIADPQITDPHSYPGRPWPLSSLTVTITDNYLRRGYKALQSHLHPDSVFFLGDLFDGGREWKTRQEGFVDPKWGEERSGEEKQWVNTWHRKYGEDFWVREYQRFAEIFFDNFNLGGTVPGPYQRGRRLVASLPGNHDIGFGAQVQVPVRNRFSAYFGDVNRVDIVGNHSIVSVDTVSLSADTSKFRYSHDLEPLYGPVNEFLEHVQSTKRKLAMEELRVWHDIDRDLRSKHQVVDLETSDTTPSPRDPGAGHADFPTILLTHVPLYRGPGTPCGPMREHWPPTKRPKGQTEPVNPDERNAISVTAGYQYQNVLSEEDSVKLIKSIGNVVHVFSGDDHDYCELVHSESKGGVREITVKSMSMAMGVSNPGFLMLSMYNPVDADGRPMPGAPKSTLQTHLCLLPNQLHTYMRYVLFGFLSLIVLAVRAFLVPALNLTPFALEPDQGSPSLLPVFKDKAEPPESRMHGGSNGTSSTSSRSASNGSSVRWPAKKSAGRSAGSRGGAGRWGWGDDYSAHGRGPRIKLDTDFYDDGKQWKAGRGKQVFQMITREFWTTAWRLTWMTVLIWVQFTRRG
ncbi:manganese ion homeostasis (Fr) [Cordyceps militaris]|uniref:Manganese ion homeostasis (Fr) n=1 Tax=Cordyceps militaris TaxID=73501 RepID=A0A2H4SJ95_CORMI|nr:manganese ion homeostasis (Fr) [Cordyceps militaris]